jgi:aspartyl aminopeptidase
LDFLRGEGVWKELQVLAEELNCDVMEVADFEMNVYDTQPSCVGGAREDFVFASRLDNLASSFCALWLYWTHATNHLLFWMKAVSTWWPSLT